MPRLSARLFKWMALHCAWTELTKKLRATKKPPSINSLHPIPLKAFQTRLATLLARQRHTRNTEVRGRDGIEKPVSCLAVALLHGIPGLAWIVRRSTMVENSPELHWLHTQASTAASTTHFSWHWSALPVRRCNYRNMYENKCVDSVDDGSHALFAATS